MGHANTNWKRALVSYTYQRTARQWRAITLQHKKVRSGRPPEWRDYSVPPPSAIPYTLAANSGTKAASW